MTLTELADVVDIMIVNISILKTAALGRSTSTLAAICKFLGCQ